jgi:hypothetical protein
MLIQHRLQGGLQVFPNVLSLMHAWDPNKHVSTTFGNRTKVVVANIWGEATLSSGASHFDSNWSGVTVRQASDRE